MTRFNCTALLPQLAQPTAAEVSGNDDELTAEADFDNGLRRRAVNGNTVDDVLDFAAFGVALAFDDFASKNDVFEVEDREVVIFKLVGCVSLLRRTSRNVSAHGID